MKRLVTCAGLALALLYLFLALWLMIHPHRARADEQPQEWFLILRYFDSKGEPAGQTVGFGFANKAECEARLAELLPLPEPEGIIEIGECTNDIRRTAPELFTVPQESLNRC